MLRFLIGFYFFLICSAGTYAQSETRTTKVGYTHAVEAMLYRGFILMHDQKIGHLIRSNPQGFRVNYLKKTYGRKYWEAHYKYPDLGLSFSFQDYRNPQLGHSFALLPFISFHPFRTMRTSLNLIMGTGLAYHTRPHHPRDNNTNVALGSAWSSALYVGFRYQIQVTPRLSNGLFFHLDHYSNGGFKKPNSGINLVQGGVSVRYELGDNDRELKHWDRKTLQNRKSYLTFLPSVSFKELGRGGGDIQPSYNLSIGLNKPLGPVSTLFLGVDGHYDVAMKNWIAQEDPELDVDFKSAALSLGHELMVDRFAFVLQVGYHFYRPYKGLFQDFFQRYGLRVYVAPRFAMSGSLKTYFGKAEQIEWGLLYRL